MSVKVVCESCVSDRCVWGRCVTRLCVCDKAVCVTKLYVREMCVTKLCDNFVCERVVCERVVCVCDKVVWCVWRGGGGGGGRRATGYRTKNKNSTQRCGEKRKLMDIGTKVLPCLPLCGFIQTQGWQQEHQTSTTYPMWLWRHAGIFARDSEKRARARSPKWCGAKTCNQAEPEPKDLASKQHVSKQQTTRGHPRTVPHLPCERAVAPQRPSAPPEPALCHKCHLPRMPRKSSVDVSKCQGCHAKAAGMSPSAACHIKETWTSPSPAPATQRAAAPWATNADQARHQSQPRALVPWLPPQTKERMPHKVRTWTKCAARASPVP